MEFWCRPVILASKGDLKQELLRTDRMFGQCHLIAYDGEWSYIVYDRAKDVSNADLLTVFDGDPAPPPPARLLCEGICRVAGEKVRVRLYRP